MNARIAALVDAEVVATQPVAGGEICAAWRIELADGRVLFAKTHSDVEMLAAEAASLRWLAAADAVPVPAVMAVDGDVLVLEWVDIAGPDPVAAEGFGRSLAGLHRAGADGFGAPWTGYAGHLPHGNDRRDTWAEFFAVHRLLPYLRLARDAGSVSADDAVVIERAIARLPALAGPDEPPARLHGDLWSGNVLWSADGRVWLVDPAAYGGHRETDLGMLTLFGAPELARILVAYDETWPLADGWIERRGLHQLHPLLVHATLFGRGYGVQAVETARTYR